MYPRVGALAGHAYRSLCGCRSRPLDGQTLDQGIGAVFWSTDLPDMAVSVLVGWGEDDATLIIFTRVPPMVRL